MSHDHEHGHDHGDDHPYQPDIEDFPFTERMVMTQAVAELIVEKGIVTADELRRQRSSQRRLVRVSVRVRVAGVCQSGAQ